VFGLAHLVIEAAAGRPSGRRLLSQTGAWGHQPPSLYRIFLQKTNSVYIFKSTSGFHFQIDFRFSFSNRNHDRDRKSFRKNQRSIFLFQTLRDFSGEIRIRFSFQNRIAIENPRCEPSFDVTVTARVDLNQLYFSQSIRVFF